MSVRIQVVVDEHEREAFRAGAAADGTSLSEWLRRAGRERLASRQPRRLNTARDLEAFFADCDQREDGREPDWEEHLTVIGESRRQGLPRP